MLAHTPCNILGGPDVIAPTYFTLENVYTEHAKSMVGDNLTSRDDLPADNRDALPPELTYDSQGLSMNM